MESRLVAPGLTRESGFYESLKSSTDAIDAEIREWVPRYFGVGKFSVGGAAETEYIVLEVGSLTNQGSHLHCVPSPDHSFISAW